MKSAIKFAIAGALLLAAGLAQAAVPVLNTSGVIAGSGSDSKTFAVGSAGVYMVTLTDHNFPAPFSFLGMAMFDGANFLGGTTSAGSFSFTAATVGSYNATVFGNTSTPSYFGSYGLTVTAVPEAETWAMMLVGVGLVGYQVRRRTRRYSPAMLA